MTDSTDPTTSGDADNDASPASDAPDSARIPDFGAEASDSFSEEERGFGSGPSSFGSADDPSFSAGEDAMGTSMMAEMASLWVREHQTASMLGAFATGVFLGALLRD
jgi:hypothetical protein